MHMIHEPTLPGLLRSCSIRSMARVLFPQCSTSCKLILVIAASFVLAACSRDADYSQATPEDTIATAKLMVERGEASKLDRLIYADSKEMRALMRRVGVMLGHLQELASSIQAQFPDDVAKMKSKVEKAAKEGRATSLFSQFAQEAMPQQGRRRRDGPPRGGEKEAFNVAIQQLFADPYGWLDESASRLTTEYLTDDKVSLRWDGKSILPPVGMHMKLAEDGKWYFALPTGFPGANRILPKTTDEYKIWASLINVFDKAIVDLNEDVRLGRIGSLDAMATKAGEKAFLPAVMVFFAYGEALKARRKQGIDAPTPVTGG